MSRLSVLQINTVVDQNNAVAKVVNGIHRRLSEAGIDSIVAYGRGNSDMDNGVRIGSCTDVIFHTLGSRLTDSEGLYSAKSTRRFLDRIDEMKIDVVHLHNIHGHYLNYPELFKWIKRRGLPVVWTLHDCWTMTGHCASFSHLDCSPGVDCKACRHLAEYPVSLISRGENNLKQKHDAFSNLGSLTVVSVSSWLKQQAEKFFPSEANHVVIENGVETNLFRPLEMPERENFVILAATNNWEPSKGLDSINKISQILRADETLRVVGNLMSQKLSGNIETAGRIADVGEMVAEYNRADLFVSPATSETFGMTAVEAMSCGLPVMVNNRTALPALVDQYSGHVVDFNDMDEVRKTIDIVRENRDFYKPRQSVLARFDIDIMARRYIDLYLSVR